MIHPLVPDTCFQNCGPYHRQSGSHQSGNHSATGPPRPQSQVSISLPRPRLDKQVLDLWVRILHGQAQRRLFAAGNNHAPWNL